MELERPDIHEVFAPRQASVNSLMYIIRDTYEKDLLRRIKGTMHVILPGDSGIGKSWMYKKVLGEHSIPYFIANCGSITNGQTLTDIVINSVFPLDTQEVEKNTSSKSGELNTGIFKGKVDDVTVFRNVNSDRLRHCYDHLRTKFNRQVVIVVDNLESIIDSKELMRELSSILLLLDDPNYSNVKFLIVGTPQEILEYFRNTDNLKSVANRMTELNRVPLLQEDGIKQFCKNGFILGLHVGMTDVQLTEISNHVHIVTMGIPQYMHEFCESLSFKIEDNGWKYKAQLLQPANQKWALSSLRQYYIELEKVVNKKESKIGRRNQILFCIAQFKNYTFTVADIETRLKANFPQTFDGDEVNVPSIMGGILKINGTFFKKLEGQNRWEVIDPKFIMILRMALFRTEEERVVLSHFKMQ